MQRKFTVAIKVATARRGENQVFATTPVPISLPDFINEGPVSAAPCDEKIYCEEATPGMDLRF